MSATVDSSGQDDNSSSERGRLAPTPRAIPWQGWKEIMRRVFNNLGNHNASLMAAGVAMFGLLAFFPTLNVIVTLYALIASPADLVSGFEPVREVMPSQAADILFAQLADLTSRDKAALNLTLLASILFGVWSARKGTVALITACNVAYGEKEKRGFFRLILVSLLFTFVGILGLVILLLVGIMLPLILEVLPMGDLLKGLINFLRWPLLTVFFIFGLQLLYRFAPSREHAKWRWVSVGAVTAAILWLAASLLFASYVKSFGNFNETYGTIGGVIVTILWFHISALVVILGAEINAEVEHQTKLDSTTAPDKPMGDRGAYVADTVGEAK